MEEPPPASEAARPSFEALYAQQFAFVWRTARRLGVPAMQLDDTVQDIFLIAHRQLPGFEGRSSAKTWLYGIARRVVWDRIRRRRPDEAGEECPDLESKARNPFDEAARSEANRVLHALLGELDEVKRETFVLSELEELSAPEIAEATGVNLNTVYARIRAARAAFERAVERFQEREGRRTP